MAKDGDICLIWEDPTGNGEGGVYVLPKEEWSPTVETLFDGEWFLNVPSIYALIRKWNSMGYGEQYVGRFDHEFISRVIFWYPKEACYCRSKSKCVCGTVVEDKEAYQYDEATLRYCHDGEKCKFCTHQPKALASTLIPIAYTPSVTPPSSTPNNYTRILLALANDAARSAALVATTTKIMGTERRCLVLVGQRSHGEYIVDEISKTFPERKCVYVRMGSSAPDADLLVMTHSTMKVLVPPTLLTTVGPALPLPDDSKPAEPAFIIPQHVVLATPLSKPSLSLRARQVHYVDDKHLPVLWRIWLKCIKRLTE